MTWHVCRICDVQEDANFLKYGPRHYAHLKCLAKAFTPEAFRNILKNKVPRHQVAGIPYFEAKELGILDLLRELFPGEIEAEEKQ